jgi:hypothetical protein
VVAAEETDDLSEAAEEADIVPIVSSEYGVDVSLPMHHLTVSRNYHWLPHNEFPEENPTPDEYEDQPLQPLGDRQQFYSDMIRGCVDFYGGPTIGGDQRLGNEGDRVAMNLRQPQSMVNYTTLGFTKIKVPDDLWELIQSFWDENSDNWEPEKWPDGNVRNTAGSCDCFRTLFVSLCETWLRTIWKGYDTILEKDSHPLVDLVACYTLDLC